MTTAARRNVKKHFKALLPLFNPHPWALSQFSAMLLRAARFAPSRAAWAAPAAARAAQLPPAAAASPPAWAQRSSFVTAPLAPRAARSAARRGLCTAAPITAAAAGALNAKQKKEMRAHAQRLTQARKLVIVQARALRRSAAAPLGSASAAKPNASCRLSGWQERADARRCSGA